MKPNIIQIIICVAIAFLSLIGLATFCWCAIARIYIDVPLMTVLNSIVSALIGSLTTLLVGRTVQQLNQNSDVKNQPQIENTQS